MRVGRVNVLEHTEQGLHSVIKRAVRSSGARQLTSDVHRLRPSEQLEDRRPRTDLGREEQVECGRWGIASHEASGRPYRSLEAIDDCAREFSWGGVRHDGRPVETQGHRRRRCGCGHAQSVECGARLVAHQLLGVPELNRFGSGQKCLDPGGALLIGSHRGSPPGTHGEAGRRHESWVAG